MLPRNSPKFETNIFDIPIYRISFEKYVKVRDTNKEKHIERQLQFMLPNTDAFQIAAARNHHSNCWDNRCFWCWRYNEIIGWISLYITPTKQIRGDLYMARGKRFSEKSKKLFEFHETIIKHTVFLNDSDQNIYNELLDTLNIMRKEDWMCNYFLDIEPFCAIGPHIKWGDVIM